MKDWCLDKRQSWLLIFMMLPYFVVPRIQAVCVEEERKALLAIKASLNDSYTYDVNPLLPTWVNHGECCEWERVKCDTTGHVTELALKNVISIVYEDYHRVWPLNISLFLHFNELRSLNLSWNYIDNTIITTGLERLSSLKKLERLDLSSNSIENGVFPSLSALTSLKVLDLSDNSLGGNFPAHELATLENLEELYLSDSSYYGTFQNQGSERVSVLKKLKILDLEGNEFSESLIASLRHFPSLKALHFGHNSLHGSFPAQGSLWLT
ncbi:putative leucine-rich repeat-containing, plant-type, leucine-rich repeat domain superfamily [Helianthus annuus]|nr:putative leucine-rich repeat-containing, plant-type, leucine-rich repeat domain superfamily [Helianthus annuus]